ncbi:hypothetical protein ACU4GR_12225 [Methylobacterium oryzae CBMB20]
MPDYRLRGAVRGEAGEIGAPILDEVLTATDAKEAVRLANSRSLTIDDARGERALAGGRERDPAVVPAPRRSGRLTRAECPRGRPALRQDRPQARPPAPAAPSRRPRSGPTAGIGPAPTANRPADVRQ